MYSAIALDISIRFILEGNVEVIIALMVVLVFSINCVILIVMNSLINVPIYINWELGIITYSQPFGLGD